MAAAPANFKTYSRKHIQQRRNSSVDVFDALLAENISKRKEAAHTKPRRRKKPIKIKELPPPDENHHLIEDSICRSWGLEDTFDRIRKEPVYNNLKPAFMTASNRSASNSPIAFINSVSSPIIHTRSYEKRHVNTSSNKEGTLEKSVTESLLIEKVPIFPKPKEITLLSSLSDGSVPPQMPSVPNYNDANGSYEPLFSTTFKETVGIKMHIASTPAVISSTPCQSVPLINETISPILNSTQPKSLIESYEEIQNWNFKPPDFELNTPKAKKRKLLKRKILQKKKVTVKNKNVNKVIVQKNSPAKIEKVMSDWKLDGEPKVVLDKCLDVIGIEKSVTFGNLNEHTLGFLPVEEDAVVKNSLTTTNIFEESFRKLCAQHNIEVADDMNIGSNVQSPVRYITLRKRKVPVVNLTTKPKTEKTDLELSSHGQNRININSKHLKVNNKGVYLKQLKQKSNSRSNSSSNSSGASTARNSIIGDAQKLIQNSICKINASNSSASYEQSNEINTELSLLDLKNRPQRSGQYSTILKLSSNNNNNKNNQLSNLPETVSDRRGDKTDRLSSVSKQLFAKLELNNSKTSENIEESYEISSDEMASPDVIPNSPEAKNRMFKIKNQRTLPGSLIEISTDRSKSLEFSQTHSNLKRRSSIKLDFTKDIDCQELQKEDTVDTSADKGDSKTQDEDFNSKILEDVELINSKNELDQKDNAEKSILEKSDIKLNDSFQKYLKQENLSSCNSILEDHNYSKVCVYDTEVIVVSSDEEDEKQNLEASTVPVDKFKKTNTTSDVIQEIDSPPKYNATITTTEPSCSDKSATLECYNPKNLLKIDSPRAQGIDSPSISNASITTTKPSCSGKSATPKCCNPKNLLKTDSPNNFDADVDFSEFITSNDKSSLKEEYDIIGPLSQSTSKDISTNETPFKKPANVFLKPGKLWRRSLLAVRRTSIICDSIGCKADFGCICSCAKCIQNKSSMFNKSTRRQSIKIIPDSPHRSIQHIPSLLEDYVSFNITYGSNTIQDVVYREKNIGEPLLVRSNSIHEPLPVIHPTVTARDIVLRRCGQAEPLCFTECYPSTLLKNCFKIGEGVYGEVFLFKHPDGTSRVMKVIPIEGAQMVNGEHQKKFEEILSEIVIAMELSDLRNDKKNKTEGFSKVEKIRCLKGRYPERLLELWELFDETRGSENDSPEMFTDNQLYIVLELANAGQDLEAFVFNNAYQALALFKQVACALAVAESALQFEHRDLHWGNILISPTDKNKKLTYCLNDQEFTLPACGIQASIIDFTLSRITYDGVCIFNDLSADPELFSATGDYQFEIYKLMQKHNDNEWQHFEPYSNILWLHYVLHKMETALRYKNRHSVIHKDSISKIKQLQNRILKYSSVKSMVIDEFLS